MSKVSIVMDSDLHLKVMKDAAKILEDFNIEYEMLVISAHKTPDRLYEYAENIKNNGIKIVIASSSGASHLSGIIASISNVPVIGVPIRTKSLNGIDSLYSILQMPCGIPVATVSIDGGANAGLLAVQMLGVCDPTINDRVLYYRKNLKDLVVKKCEQLSKVGYKKYIRNYL